MLPRWQFDNLPSPIESMGLPLHQMKALLAEGSSSVCSTVVLPIALNTTLLWDVSGVEGRKVQFFFFFFFFFKGQCTLILAAIYAVHATQPSYL